LQKTWQKAAVQFTAIFDLKFVALTIKSKEDTREALSVLMLLWLHQMVQIRPANLSCVDVTMAKSHLHVGGIKFNI
jgi:hypothetical protein